MHAWPLTLWRVLEPLLMRRFDFLPPGLYNDALCVITLFGHDGVAGLCLCVGVGVVLMRCLLSEHVRMRADVPHALPIGRELGYSSDRLEAVMHTRAFRPCCCCHRRMHDRLGRLSGCSRRQFGRDRRFEGAVLSLGEPHGWRRPAVSAVLLCHVSSCVQARLCGDGHGFVGVLTLCRALRWDALVLRRNLVKFEA
jgi:hypothetical protein